MINNAHPGFPQSQNLPGEKFTRNCSKMGIKSVRGELLPPSWEPAPHRRLSAGPQGRGSPGGTAVGPGGVRHIAQEEKHKRNKDC